MSNKPMLSVELRALLERVVAHDFAEDCQECGIGQSEVWRELRALLDEPDEPFSLQGWSIDHSAGRPILMHNKCSVIEAEQAYGLLNLIESAAQHQGEPVAWVTQCHLSGLIEQAEPNEKATNLQCWSDAFPVFREQPAPVAVVMPDDWEDQLFAEMSRRFDLRKMIDDDHMVYDDTQIGVEFARDWVKARLSGVKP